MYIRAVLLDALCIAHVLSALSAVFCFMYTFVFFAYSCAFCNVYNDYGRPVQWTCLTGSLLFPNILID